MTSFIGTLSHEITVSISIYFYFLFFVNPITRGEVTDSVKLYSCTLHAIEVHMRNVTKIPKSGFFY